MASPAASEWLIALVPSDLNGHHLDQAIAVLDQLVEDPLLGPARRDVARRTGGATEPAWAYGALDDAMVGEINYWLSARTWPQQLSWLDSHVSRGEDADLRQAVDLAARLFPENGAVAQLADLLAGIASGAIQAPPRQLRPPFRSGRRRRSATHGRG